MTSYLKMKNTDYISGQIRHHFYLCTEGNQPLQFCQQKQMKIYYHQVKQHRKEQHLHDKQNLFLGFQWRYSKPTT